MVSGSAHRSLAAGLRDDFRSLEGDLQMTHEARDEDRRVYETFRTVQSCEPGERATALDRVCAGDLELRAEGERLLGGHEATSREGSLDPAGFHFAEARVRSAGELTTNDFEDGAGGVAAGQGADRYPEVPGYLILGELGRGGMGTVLRARDSRL